MQSQEQRAFFAVLLAMGVLLLWSVLFRPEPVTQRERGLEPDTTPATTTGLRPTGETPSGSTPPEAGSSTPPTGSIVRVLTGQGAALRQSADAPTEIRRVRVDGEDLSLVFDGKGARLVEAVVRDFQETPQEAVQLIPEGSAGALGSVLVLGGSEIPLDQFVFALESDVESTEGRRLSWELRLEEVTLRKTFIIPRRGNLFHVEHELVEDRVGVQSWGLSWASGIRVTEEQKANTRGAYFNGTVLAEGKVQRKTPAQLRKAPMEFPGHTYFVGLANKYFLGAIVPRGDAQGPARLWTTTDGEKPSIAGEILVERTAGLAANVVEYDVYAGPLDYAELKDLGIGIEGAVDLGMAWIRPLSRTILSLLIWAHGIIPNYGVVIIIFSSLMNLAFFPLTYKSTKSMRDMAALKPRMDALKEKHKEDPQKLQEATMRLYKEAGVNPLAGCMPLILQMPIFFALYAVLFHTIEIRQAPFVFWIRDLSQPDVVFTLPFALPLVGSGISLLPIIMGITSYFQSKQTMVDPNQKMMATMMPVMMTFIFFTMPSGLVLYWLTSNLFTIGQKSIMKPSTTALAIAEEAPEKPASKRSGKKPRKSRPQSKASTK